MSFQVSYFPYVRAKENYHEKRMALREQALIAS